MPTRSDFNRSDFNRSALSENQTLLRSKVEREFSKFLDNPDLTLKKERAFISIYERLLYDSRVWATLNKLLLYLQNFDWRIVSRVKNPPKRELKFLEETFYRLDFLDNYAFDCILVKFFGYGVAEMLISIDEGVVSLDKLRWLPQRWFEFDSENNLCWHSAPPARQDSKTTFRLLNAYKQPEIVKHANEKEITDINEFKIILVQHCASYDNPYGEGDASRLFYEVLYRNAARQFRSYAAERFGLPTVHISYPIGTTQEKAQEVTDVVSEYISKGVFALPENYKIHSYSAPVDVSIFLQQIEDADRLIQDIILLQSAGQDLQRVGARAAIEAFEAATYKGVWATKRLVEKTANQVIDALCIFNGFSRSFYFELYDAQKFDPIQELEMDEKLMNVAGVKFSKEYWYEKYKLDPKSAVFPEDRSAEQARTQNANSDASTNANPDENSDENSND